MDVFDAIQLPDYSIVERPNHTQVMPSRVRQIASDSATRLGGPNPVGAGLKSGWSHHFEAVLPGADRSDASQVSGGRTMCTVNTYAHARTGACCRGPAGRRTSGVPDPSRDR